MANKLLNYTTHDSEGQPSADILVGLPWPDMRMDRISLTHSDEDLLCYNAKQPEN